MIIGSLVNTVNSTWTSSSKTQNKMHTKNIACNTTQCFFIIVNVLAYVFETIFLFLFIYFVF